MYRRGRIRPSRSASLIGMIAGFVITIIFASIFLNGPFGSHPSPILFMMVFPILITVGHAYNFFSRRGLAQYEVDVESASPNDFETKLRKLERLRRDSLITQEEYERKRADILTERW